MATFTVRYTDRGSPTGGQPGEQWSGRRWSLQFAMNRVFLGSRRGTAGAAGSGARGRCDGRRGGAEDLTIDAAIVVLAGRSARRYFRVDDGCDRGQAVSRDGASPARLYPVIAHH